MADRVTTGSDSRNFRGKLGCLLNNVFDDEEELWMDVFVSVMDGCLCKCVIPGGFFNVYCIAPITGAGILAAKFEIGEITCFQKQLQTN